MHCMYVITSILYIHVVRNIYLCLFAPNFVAGVLEPWSGLHLARDVAVGLLGFVWVGLSLIKEFFSPPIADFFRVLSHCAVSIPMFVYCKNPSLAEGCVCSSLLPLIARWRSYAESCHSLLFTCVFDFAVVRFVYVFSLFVPFHLFMLLYPF